MARHTVTYYASAVVYVTVEVEADDAGAAEAVPLADAVSDAIEHWDPGAENGKLDGNVRAVDIRRTDDWEVLSVREKATEPSSS